MLCFRFRYPYLGIWFSEPYVWISFYCFWMSIILCKRLWNFFWKCQFFVRIYGTMCIVIFLGEVLTSMRVCECCSRNVTSSFLIHGNSSSKTYLANRSFLFVPTKGTLLNGTPIKQYVFDSLRFTIVLSTQIGKWSLQNEIPIHLTLRVPSSRLFLTCRIFSFWNFHFPIFLTIFEIPLKACSRAENYFFFALHVGFLIFKILISEKKLTISESTVQYVFIIFRRFWVSRICGNFRLFLY